MTLFSVIAIFLSASSWAGDVPTHSRPVLHYEPVIVELTGKIEQQTFPGSPNYESILDGDEAEKGWYLRLDRPIDAIVKKNDAPSSESENELNVKIVHLAWGESQDLDKKVSHATKLKVQVRLKGHLFHRWSGHHHSRVLMWVDQLVEPSETKK